MRKFFLAVSLALLLAGTVTVSSADAQVRRGGRTYIYGYPAYSYPSAGYYNSPGVTTYYGPTYSYGAGYYYPSGRYDRGWRR